MAGGLGIAIGVQDKVESTRIEMMTVGVLQRRSDGLRSEALGTETSSGETERLTLTEIKRDLDGDLMHQKPGCMCACCTWPQRIVANSSSRRGGGGADIAWIVSLETA